MLCHGLGAEFFLRDVHFSAYLGLCTWLWLLCQQLIQTLNKWGEVGVQTFVCI